MMDNTAPQREPSVQLEISSAFLRLSDVIISTVANFAGETTGNPDVVDNVKQAASDAELARIQNAIISPDYRSPPYLDTVNSAVNSAVDAGVEFSRVNEIVRDICEAAVSGAQGSYVARNVSSAGTKLQR